ncbi:MAG: hypothetical protein ACRDV3_00260 [Acidothermaceae bacterium]
MREARRAAEKVARARVSERVKLIGELGVLVKRREQAATAVITVQARADAMVEAARIAGQKLVDAAEQHRIAVDESYERAYRAALSAGWAAEELGGIGLPSVPPATNSR